MIDSVRDFRTDSVERGIAGASNQQCRTSSDDFFRDRRNLGRRFSKAENHFRKSLANGAMVIDTREAKVGIRLGAHRFEETLLGDCRIERTRRTPDR